MSSAVEEMQGRLAQAGIGPGFAQVVAGDARELDGGAVPDRWYVTPLSDGTWVVGAFDRGSFAVYDRYETSGLAAGAVRHLHEAPIEVVTLDSATVEQARERAEGLADHVRTLGPPSPDAIPVGTAFDTYGTLANHTLFTWRTPVPARANPPTDVARPYTQVILRRPLPPDVRCGVMGPAFEQPGGGVALGLPRCLRWYYDAGIVDVFVTAATG